MNSPQPRPGECLCEAEGKMVCRQDERSPSSNAEEGCDCL